MSGLEVFGTVSAVVGLVQATASLYNYLSSLNDEKREIADLAKEMNTNVEKLKQFYQDNKEVLDKNGLTPAARDLVQEMIQLKKYAEKEAVSRKGFKGLIKSVLKRGGFPRKLRQFNGNIDRSYKHWQMSIQVTNLSHIDELEKQNRALEAEIAQQKALLKEKRRLNIIQHGQLRNSTAWAVREVASSLDQLLQGVRAGFIQAGQPMSIEAEPRVRYKNSPRILIRVNAKIAVFSIVTADSQLDHKRIKLSLDSYNPLTPTLRPIALEDETYDLIPCIQESQDAEALLLECQNALKEVIKVPTDLNPQIIVQKMQQIALVLWQLGLKAEAQHIAKCTVDLARCLAKYQPDNRTFKSDLASALVAVVRVYEGHPSVPRKYYTEAVELRRALAAKDKIGTSEEAVALASTLATAAFWARAEGYFDMGMDWIEAASLMEQELNRGWAEKHRQRLASCLMELGFHLHINRHLDDAVFVFSEAVRHFRHFVLLNPTMYSLPLVRSLRGWGTVLAHHGEYDASDAAFEESLRILHGFPRSVPDWMNEIYHFELSRTLVSYAHSIAARQEWEDAVAFFAPALNIFSSQPTLEQYHDPEWYQRSGRTHALLLERTKGARSTGTALLEDALNVAREQYEAHPDRYRFKYAGCLSTRAWVLCKSSGRAFDALEYAEEAVELGRILVLDQPRAYRVALAYYLEVLGTVLCEVEQVREGIKKLNEALNVLCTVYHTERSKNLARRRELLDTIESVGNLLSEHQAPLEALWEALALV